MIVIYRESTGQVVDNSGTNSLYPDGLPDDLVWTNTPDRAGLAYLRLHDEHDADLVAAVLTGHVRVVAGSVVMDDTVIPPVPTPVPPSGAALLAQIVALQEWAAQVQAQVDAATEILMGGLQ